ncbi:hypothetical protein BGZ58_002738 [Dissophora ornata]|nr:hypothetical protein BGZ58_002738 [Dissophora ornata]
MISLRIENHKIRFRNYPNSFTAEGAITNLGSLQFVQSNRGTDPNDPTRIITNVTTTQFSLSRDMAKNLCQTFMDARLFESATDPSRREFQNRGLYQVTPKGAHILAKFVVRNSLPVEDTRHITTNATENLVHLERADDEDAIILTLKHVDAIFKRFAGPEPNMAKGDTNGSSGGGADSASTFGSGGSWGRDRTPSATNLCNGIEVMDQQFNYETYKHAFYGKYAVEWLLDYAMVISKEEAIRICQEMVSAGYIEQVSEETRGGPSLFKTGSAALYHLTETGRALVGWKSLDDNDWMDICLLDTVAYIERTHLELDLLSVQFKLKCSSNTSRLPISIIANEYRKSTDEADLTGLQYGGGGSSSLGSSTSRLSQILNDPAFQITLSEAGSSGSNSGGVGGSGRGPMLSYAPSSSGRESVGMSAGGSRQSTPLSSTSQSTTSNTSRLNGILSDTVVRDLFKNFLKQNICGENLSFCLEVLDYKSKFSTLISTARAYQQSASGQEQMTWKENNEQNGWGGWGLYPPSLREFEKQICMQAFAIFETYLLQGASGEVNLPHQMRQDITNYMQAVVRNMETSKGANNKSEDTTKTLSPTPSSPSSPSSSPSTSSATKSSSEAEKVAGTGQKELIHISLFDTVHDHIFRLMSEDSVPKFIKTDKYLEVMMSKHKRKNATNANGNANRNRNGTGTLPHTHGMTLKEAVLTSDPEINGGALIDDSDLSGGNGGGGGSLKNGNNSNALSTILGSNRNEGESKVVVEIRR